MKFLGVIIRTVKQAGRTGEAEGAEQENIRTENIMEYRREDCGLARSAHCLGLASQGIPQTPNEEKLEANNKHVVLYKSLSRLSHF